MLNKPSYIGFTVLDLSKWKMYDFHYNFIKKSFNAELLFTDTDSLTYEVKWKNVYEEFLKWKNLLEFNFWSGKIYLSLVIIQKIQGFLMRLIKKLLVKWKMNLGELL